MHIASSLSLPINRPFNLIIAGVGGQGILLAARIIAEAAHLDGLIVSVGETFGASRRGGTVLSHLRYIKPDPRNLTSQKRTVMGSLVPHCMVDVLMGLEPLEALRAASFLNPKSSILLNQHLRPPIDVIAGKTRSPSFLEIQTRLSGLSERLWTIDAESFASQAGEIRTINSVMIGALAGLGLTHISNKAFEKALAKQFELTTIRTINTKAYRLGFQHFKKTN